VGESGATSLQAKAHEATPYSRSHGGERQSHRESESASESRSDSESVERAQRLLRAAAEYRRMEPCLLCDLTLHVIHPTSELPCCPANFVATGIRACACLPTCNLC
jgi:hypothetical protein